MKVPGCPLLTLSGHDDLVVYLLLKRACGPLGSLTANSVDFGLKLLAPLSAIEEAKQDFQPLRQFLGVVKFGATVLSGEQHFRCGDAHRRLRDF
jgi:hypothetical protein